MAVTRENRVLDFYSICAQDFHLTFGSSQEQQLSPSNLLSLSFVRISSTLSTMRLYYYYCFRRHGMAHIWTSSYELTHSRP